VNSIYRCRERRSRSARKANLQTIFFGEDQNVIQPIAIEITCQWNSAPLPGRRSPKAAARSVEPKTGGDTDPKFAVPV